MNTRCIHEELIEWSEIKGNEMRIAKICKDCHRLVYCTEYVPRA